MAKEITLTYFNKINIAGTTTLKATLSRILPVPLEDTGTSEKKKWDKSLLSSTDQNTKTVNWKTGQLTMYALHEQTLTQESAAE